VLVVMVSQAVVAVSVMLQVQEQILVAQAVQV
jgi:hypothetical protein